MNGSPISGGNGAAKRLPKSISSNNSKDIPSPPLSAKAITTAPLSPTSPNPERPRHFASYHPVHRPGSSHDASGIGGTSGSSRRKGRKMEPSPTPRGRPRGRSPAPPGHTQQGPAQKPRPSPGSPHNPPPPRFLSPDSRVSRNGRDSSAPAGERQPRPSNLRQSRSLTSLRAQQQQQSSFSSPPPSLRGIKKPPNPRPTSPGRGPPPSPSAAMTAARHSGRHNQPNLQGPTRQADIPRSSLQSATTRSSSANPTSPAERSSTMTKSSSTTDLTSDSAAEDGGGMSVDDAIAMYLDGFMDDPIPESLEEEELSEESRSSPQDSMASVNGMADDPPTESDKPPNPPNPTPTDRPRPTSPASPEETSSTPLSSRPLSFIPSSAPPSLPPPQQRTSPPSSRHFSPPPPSKATFGDILSGPIPPPLSAVTSNRDRYGFQKSTAHITTEQYDSWYSSYADYIDTRRQKWVELLTNDGLQLTNPTAFPSRSFKVKRYVRKGIPPEFRGPAWFWYADGHSHLRRNPGLYQRLVDTALKRPMNDDKEHIERDLNRTFPDNIHFKPQETAQDSANGTTGTSDAKAEGHHEPPVIQSLRRVLYAFSVHNPKIGYTQSLNFVVGMLLLFLPEEKAFWMLHIITSTFLPGTHEVSLEGANADLWILMVVMRESVPAVYTKVASSEPTTVKSKPPAITTTTRLPDITLGLTNWLMSMFISSLPLETTLRVWDVLFYEGARTFFRVALAIFRLSQKSILAVTDPMEIFQLVQTAPKQMLDPNVLLDECFARRFRLSQSRLESLRAARREAIREDKQRLSQLPGLGKLRAGTDWRPHTAAVANPLPGAWRSLKNHLR